MVKVIIFAHVPLHAVSTHVCLLSYNNFSSQFYVLLFTYFICLYGLTFVRMSPVHLCEGVSLNEAIGAS
jgi:hypothetical protein